MHRVPLGWAIGIFVFQLFLILNNPELFSDAAWLTIGLNGILIIVALVQRSAEAEKEKEQLNFRLEYERQEVERILKNSRLNNKSKIAKIIKLYEEGSLFASAFLKKIAEDNEEE